MQNAVEVDDSLFHYWTAFWELDCSRQIGLGIGPIPVSEIKAYCDLCGIGNPIERHRLMRMVQVLDREYLAIEAERRDQKAG